VSGFLWVKSDFMYDVYLDHFGDSLKFEEKNASFLLEKSGA